MALAWDSITQKQIFPWDASSQRSATDIISTIKAIMGTTLPGGVVSPNMRAFSLFNLQSASSLGPI